MVKTGITRRIDELGRLVIPKEIRNNLKIRDNDQIEITVIDNKIILNKYDYLNKDRVINIVINLLKKTINKNILLTSRDRIIDYALLNKELINNIVFTKEIMNIIENRKDVVSDYNNIGILNNKDLSYSISPLIINGDLYGSLIVFSDNRITNNEIDIILYTKAFLENYLE